MDISGLGSTSSSSSATSTASTAKSSTPAFSQVKIQNDSQLVSMLPSPSFGGLGGNVDLYDAISKQSQGLLMAGGRTAMEIANISLGIDMSQSYSVTDSSATGASASAPATTTGTAAAATPAKPDPASAITPPSGSQNLSMLDQILKEGGYVAPTADPYVVNKDFFADQVQNTAPPASPYYTSQSLSNPALGGLLNSLG
jgi:hypothetical protein